MATVTELLNIARAEVGTKENPAGSNNVKYNTWFYGRTINGSGYAWCMAFVQWCFNQAKMPLGKVTAGCTTFMNWAKTTGQWYTSNYKPGDVLLFDFDSDKGESEHTGICESVTGNIVNTIEGNTWIGNDTAGGAVMKRQRSTSVIIGAYRPKYDEEKKKDIALGEITSVNGSRGADCLVLLVGKSSTGFNKWGVDVIFDNTGTVLKVVNGGENTTIPSGCYCLSGHGKQTSYLISHYKVGSKIKVF